jgi:hypothetical protein
MFSTICKMGFVRALLAHGLRPALCAGGDVRGGARQSWLAGLARVRIDSRRDGLCADVRHGVQSHRGPEVRREESAHGESASARRDGFASERLDALFAVSGGLDCGELFPESAVLLAFTSGAGGDLFLLADETLHGLHPLSSSASRSRWRRWAPGWRCAAQGFRSGGAQMMVLSVAVIFWLVGFDIIYALQDYEFDKSHGPAFARRGVGTEERARRCVSRAPHHVRSALCLRTALSFPDRLHRWLDASSSAVWCWSIGSPAAAA